MSKRTFEYVDGFDEVPHSVAARWRIPPGTHLEGTLENGKKVLFRALKISRGFERQKLGRRQKKAKEENATAELNRLAGEVTALKVSTLAVSVLVC